MQRTGARREHAGPGAGARGGWRGPLVVFGVALVLRLVYWLEIAGHPLVEVPIVDARAYDEWAQRIVAEGAWGTEAFYQAPAYPYLLAALYGVFGRDLAVVHVVQMVMGALSCVWLHAGTRALFGDREATAAGLMLAVYPPAIFFDGLIGKQSLGLFLLTGMGALLLRHQRRPSVAGCAGAGLALGVLALTRENTLIFLPAIPLWLFFVGRDRPLAARAREVAAFAGVALAVLLFVGLRNLAVGDTFALTTSQMGPNFYMGNSEHATGLYVPLVPSRHTPVYEAPDAERLAEAALGRELTRGEVSRYWLDRGLAFVREHPGRWLLLMVRKVLLTWHAYEIADVEDIHVYADGSRLLQVSLPLWGFGLLAPLAAGGLALAWGRRRELSLLLYGMAIYTLSVALFITFARFRYPLVPMLIPLAAFGVVEAARRVRAGDHHTLGVPLVVVALVGLLVRLPLVDEDRLLMNGYANVGGLLLGEGRIAEAEPHLLRAMELDPQSADLRFRMAVLRQQQGRLDEAEAHLLEMSALAPRDERAPRMLAVLYRETGREAEARREAARASRLDPLARPGPAPPSRAEESR